MTDTQTPVNEIERGEPRDVIPDDPEKSVYRFIIVAAKRARQLQSGSRPKVHSPSKKMTRLSVEEVRRGLVGWMDPENLPEEPEFQAEEEFTDQ